MSDLPDNDQQKSVEQAYRIIVGFKAMTPSYQNRAIKMIRKLHDPGPLAQEIKAKIMAKGLNGEQAARYFFKSWMNAVNE